MDFQDVSNWLKMSAPSTKGTRDKFVLIKPDTEDMYFLKFPMVRKNRDYTPENWSEVLAYEIGNALGFNVLRYDLAAHNGRVGCISKNMTIPGNNETLVEGHSILSHHDSTYDPSDKNAYSRYTFGFVRDALISYNAETYLADFIHTLVFDAIIGNSDRHQSNWGIVQSINIEKETPSDKRKWFPFGKSKEVSAQIVIRLVHKAAPIYDSGCCLGREFGEEQLQKHLNCQSKFDTYIRKGVAELRTSETQQKPSHEELLKFIKTTNNGEYKAFVENAINRVLHIYNPDSINNLILNIDNNLPEQYKAKYGITSTRKEFIFRVIDTRINNLKNI